MGVELRICGHMNNRNREERNFLELINHVTNSILTLVSTVFNHFLQQVQSCNLVCGWFNFESTVDYASWTFARSLNFYCGGSCLYYASLRFVCGSRFFLAEKPWILFKSNRAQNFLRYDFCDRSTVQTGCGQACPVPLEVFLVFGQSELNFPEIPMEEVCLGNYLSWCSLKYIWFLAEGTRETSYACHHAGPNAPAPNLEALSLIASHRPSSILS